MLNFVICDDNKDSINKMSNMLNSIFIQNDLDGEILFSTQNPFELFKYIQNNYVDVAILDIDFNNKKIGLNLAESIRNLHKNIYIIFVTGHLEFGLEAYQYKTFDYIPKPLTIERFSNTILRLFDDVKTDNPTYLRLNNNKTIIPQNAINFIQKDGMKLVFSTENRNYTVYNSFNKISNSLPNQFVRCHKSYIVNLNKISHIDFTSNTISFDNNKQCYIGPKYKDNFKKILNNYENSNIMFKENL